MENLEVGSEIGSKGSPGVGQVKWVMKVVSFAVGLDGMEKKPMEK